MTTKIIGTGKVLSMIGIWLSNRHTVGVTGSRRALTSDLTNSANFQKASAYTNRRVVGMLNTAAAQLNQYWS
jgi:hypothetical protein